MDTSAPTEAPPQWAAQLFQMIQTQNEQMVVQNQRMIELEQRLQQQNSSRGPTTPSRATTPPVIAAEVRTGTEPVRRKDKLPELSEFNGTRAVFRPWLTQARAKLEVDRAGESEAVRFWYLQSRLRGNALSQLSSWVDSVQSTPLMTVEGLISQLKAAYDDTETAERASRKLSTMKQGARTFSTFLADFDRTILDAGGLDWVDQVKKTFLTNCISYELQNAIVATPTPASYREFCTLLHSVSANLEALHRRKPRASEPTYGVKTSPSEEDTMDWEPQGASQASVVRPRQRATWVSQATLDQRRERGQCLRCGQQGHFVQNCSLGPAKRPQGQRVVVGTASTTTEAIESEGLKEQLLTKTAVRSVRRRL